MKPFKFLLFTVLSIILTSCASGYHKINPSSINYFSKNQVENVTLEYKYNLLNGKYSKKETKKNIRVVALKITNNSDRDLVFGKDIVLTYENGNSVLLMESERVFSDLKQSPATHLLYLLLSPLQIYTYKTNQYGFREVSSSFPIGLILGPGIAGGNLIGASSANKNFKNELVSNNIIGKTIKKGQTDYGLIGIQSNSYDTLKLRMN